MNTSALSERNTFQFAWLNGLAFDSIFVFGIFLLAVTSGVVVSIRPDLFIPVMVADLWLLGYHHVISTFTKLAGTKEDRKQNWILLYPLPFIVILVVGVIVNVAGVWVIATIYLFWQWFHYVRQSWGISAFYKRKAGIMPSRYPRLDQAVFWAIPVWGILYRCAQGWDKFLFLEIWMPPVPMFVADIAGVFAGIAMIYWAHQRYQHYRAGQLSLGLTSFELSHFAIFFIAYIALSEINHGWLTANIWHNAQYILFVWLYNVNRFHPEKNSNKQSVIAWLSQKTPIRTFVYFIFCLGIAILFYSNMQSVLAFFSKGDLLKVMVLNVVIFQALNFHHYIVDSIIWKARNKANRTVMKVN